MNKEGRGVFPRLVIFGGTTEGRLLAEWCSARGIPALYCAATELGALSLPGVTSRIGRLDFDEMTALLRGERAALVVDATHPYAAEASVNILKAAGEAGAKLLRITRPPENLSACRSFAGEDELVDWLSGTKGVIFAACGLTQAPLFTRVPDFEKRVYLRLLPGIEGLKTCLGLGFPPPHIIMMYGPFSRDLNRAMFQACAARILVTKDSGVPGGFTEKVMAAKDIGMEIALIARPPEAAGKSLSIEQGIDALEKFLKGENE